MKGKLAKKITEPTGHRHIVTSRPEFGSHVRLGQQTDGPRVLARSVGERVANGYASDLPSFNGRM